MTATLAIEPGRRPGLGRYVLMEVLAVGDACIVFGSVIAVRAALVASPLYDAALPQWQPIRTYAAGGIGAALYLMLAWAGRLFSVVRPQPRLVLPALNLLNCGLLLAFGLIACGRYAAVTEDAQLLPRRLLFFAALLSYVATTLAHYAAAPRHSINAQEAP